MIVKELKMEKEKKIFSVISTLAAYVFLREKYPDYEIDKEVCETDIDELKDRVLGVEKYAHIPDRNFILVSKYNKLKDLMCSKEFKEEILLDSLNKKAEYLTLDEKRDIINSVIYVMNSDHSISKNEKFTIIQISKFLKYDFDVDSIMKEYKNSEFKESVSTVGLSYFTKASDHITKDKKLNDKNQRVLSLLFLSLAAALSFFEFTRFVEGSWFTSDHVEKVYFAPTFISAIIAIALSTPLYLRNILKWNTSIYSIVSLMLIMLVFASFVQLTLLGGNDNIVMQASLIVAILLSWLGMREVSGITWIIVLGAGIYIVVSNNITMGFYGYLYIIFGFLGLILHSKLSPGELVKGLKGEYAEGTSKVIDTVKGDIQTTSSRIGSLAKGGI